MQITNDLYKTINIYIWKKEKEEIDEVPNMLFLILIQQTKPKAFTNHKTFIVSIIF